MFVTSSQMSTLALTKTCICVQKTWEKGFEGFMVGATDQPLGQTSQFNTFAFHIILWGVILGKQWAVYLLLWLFLYIFFHPRKKILLSHVAAYFSPISQTLIVICGCHTQSTLYLTICSAEHMSVTNTAWSQKTTIGHRWIRGMHQLGRKDIYLIYCRHDGGWHTTLQTEVILHLCRALELCVRGSLAIPGSVTTLWILRSPVVPSHLRISTHPLVLDRFQIFLLHWLDSCRSCY